MNNKLWGLLIVLVVAVVAPMAAFAESDQITQTESTEQSTIDVDAKSKRDARILEYKNKSVEKLSQAEENKLAGMCKGAQTVVANMQTNLDKALEKRQTTYQKISDNLAGIVEKLKVAGVDTTELEVVIASVETQTAQVIALIQTHQTTLADLVLIDCSADPAGFKSALQAAREDRKSIVTASQAVKRYVTDNLKPILKTIRENLAAREGQTEGVQQ